MKKLYVVTHTEAIHHAEGKVGGWFDSGLTEQGIHDAEALRLRMLGRGIDPDALDIHSSDLQRTRQTAEILAPGDSKRIVFDPRLREMSFGEHEGLSQVEHQKAMQPSSRTSCRLDHRICPGAESRREVATRIAASVSEIMRQTGDALIVTHGFAGTFVIAAFQRIGIESMGYIDYKLKSGSLTELEADERFQNRSIRRLNG